MTFIWKSIGFRIFPLATYYVNVCLLSIPYEVFVIQEGIENYDRSFCGTVISGNQQNRRHLSGVCLSGELQVQMKRIGLADLLWKLAPTE